jgi:hypothetical protein
VRYRMDAADWENNPYPPKEKTPGAPIKG